MTTQNNTPEENGAQSKLSTDWHHAPPHKLIERGIYMVTAGTLQKERFFRDPARLKLLHDHLLEYAADFHWQLQAWGCSRTTTTSLPQAQKIPQLCANS